MGLGRVITAAVASGVDIKKMVTGVVIWIGVLFFPAELTAHFWKSCPWPTLSGTVWDAIRWWHPLAYMILGFCLILVAHFEFKISAGWLVLFGAITGFVIGLHVLLR